MRRRSLLLAFPGAVAAVAGCRADVASRGEVVVREPDTSPSLTARQVPVRPIDRTPQRILVVGDSMVFNLLPVFADYCLENGHHLHPALWWGSTSTGWAGGRKLDELFIRHRPTTVWMVLGSSEVLGQAIHQLVPRAAEKLRDRIAPRKLLWLGPPSWLSGKLHQPASLAKANRGANDVTAALTRVLGAGKVFNSTSLDLERENDGIHPTPAGGRSWAEHFITWVRDESDHPILLHPPAKKAPIPRATSYGPAWKTAKG